MNKEKKTTNEKPVSLSSLDFKEALTAFLKTKPASKEEMDRALKEQKKQKKSNKQDGFLQN